MKILVSACLMGIACRYDGKCTDCMNFPEGIEPVPFCPEVYGGLTTPRPASEIRNDRVVNNRGEDVTAQFERGGREAAALCQRLGIRLAVTQDKSPSCGAGRVHNGLFDGGLVDGEGIAVRLLREAGVAVLPASAVQENPGLLLDRAQKP